jgi:hypothetical protein
MPGRSRPVDGVAVLAQARRASTIARIAYAFALISSA